MNWTDVYAKPEVLLGDLRTGVCSSGLCKQLRAVAADEIDRLTREPDEARATCRGWLAANAPGGWVDGLRMALRGIATNRLASSTNQTPAYNAGVKAGLAMAADMASRALNQDTTSGDEPPWCCLCNTRHTLSVGCPVQKRSAPNQEPSQS